MVLGKNKDIRDAELWVIFKALGIALKKTAFKKTYKVIVFSDSQMVLRKIQVVKFGVGQVLKVQIVKKAKEL